MAKKQKKKMTITPKTDRLKALAKKKKSKIGFYQGFKDELKKVTWTTKEELTICTKIVVGSIFFLGLGVYVIDLSLKGMLDGIKVLSHLIFG